MNLELPDRKEWLAYGSIVAGLAIYCVWLLSVRTAFAEHVSSLPVDYTVLPPQSLYWIAILLIIIPFTITSLPRGVRYASLILILFLVLFAYPLLSPFGLPNGRDAQYSYQATQLIADTGYWQGNAGTGQAMGYSNFPGMLYYQLYIKSLMGIGTADAVMWGIALLRFITLPLLIFVMFNTILRKHDLAVLAVFLYFTNPSLTNHPHYEGMAIVFMFLAMHFLFISDSRSTLSALLLAIGLAGGVIVTHHFTSYLFFGWMATLVVLGVFVKLASRIPLVQKLPLQVFKRPTNLFMPLAFFILLTGIFIAYSLTIGSQQFALYTTGLDQAILSKLNPRTVAPAEDIAPAPEPGEVPTASPRSPLPKETVTQLSFLDQIRAKLFAIGENITQGLSKALSLLELGNFKPLEVYTVFAGIILLGTIVGLGLLARYKEATFFEWGTAAYFGMFVFAGILVIVVTRFNIISRIFEFAYIAAIPFAIAGLQILQKVNERYKQWILSFVLIALFATGNLLLIGGQQRYYYVPEEKLVLDSSFMFLTPGTVAMTQWMREHLRFNQVVGDVFIFDTVGAYGFTQVHYYEPQLIRAIYQPSNTVSVRGRQLVKWDNATTIFTHKYLDKYPGSTGGPYASAAVRKFDNLDWANKVYDSNTLQAYWVSQQIP